jgi:hypothetical protein
MKKGITVWYPSLEEYRMRVYRHVVKSVAKVCTSQDSDLCLAPVE